MKTEQLKQDILNQWESVQFVIFKPLRYCFKETIGFDVKASFASRPVSRLISWYNNQVYNKRILIKGYSVPRNFSWIEKITNCMGFSKLHS